MSTDRKIALSGIGLAVLALVPIFRDTNTQVIVAYCVAFGLLAGFFLYAVFRTSGPQFTTTAIKKVLTIHDAAG